MPDKEFIRENNKTRNKSPKPRYRTSREYDFLQYIRVVMKWAVVNHDLVRGEVEMLLYLYPKGVFTMQFFSDFHKTYGMYQQKTLAKLIEGGWIHLWRPKKNRQAALYALTDKAKRMCDRMHKFSTGEEAIPETKFNRLSTIGEGQPRIHNYYFDIIKKMNKNRNKKEDEV